MRSRPLSLSLLPEEDYPLAHQRLKLDITLVKSGDLIFSPTRPKLVGSSLFSTRTATIVVKGKRYTASSVVWAWFWHKGEPPKGELRHADGDTSNNDIQNLILREGRLQRVVTADLLREYATYDPENGDFKWVKKVSERTKLGVASSPYATDRGNRRHTVSFMRQLRHLTHWIWLYVTGEKVWEMIPTRFVDHINGDPSDNRWENLRLVTPQQNQSNRRPQVRKAHPDLPTGVVPNASGTRFQGKTSFKRVIHKTPWLNTPEAAHEAYQQLHAELHGTFSVYASRPETSPEA